MPTAAQRLEVENALRHWDRYWAGNSVLDAFDIDELEGPRDQRFRARLALVNDQQMAELQDFFDLRRERHRIWGLGFRLFVSHIAQSVQQLLPLTEALKRYGIVPFLAHEHIAPGQLWHRELTTALSSMDALLSFHSAGFAQSPWCGQEVGYALGRGVLVLPVRGGEDPGGFVGEIQGIPWNPQNVPRTVGLVIANLRENPQTRVALGDTLARELKYSGSFDRSDFLVEQLQQLGPLTEGAHHSIGLALKFNDQVRGRNNAEDLINPEEDAA
ncbi:toll/interleukin-1 receptor domain-containing protein [Hyphomicrobium sp. LHD-15]|uniref:toll/interleukin-1 receptor domain-containing protein n=1 Tax=Hyphomicrobium sp. LHD-15 TaxID=3072142 RepID=UPI00280E64F5|nr:toll/interleukin-1 receptor domain-containing protein [Hyphomicrobium sp. LHD-15]MDQ8699249.1 toll/interleukin-1 receptor domain-containing protein [Hyphomicrobium sp. LHD-15]